MVSVKVVLLDPTQIIQEKAVLHMIRMTIISLFILILFMEFIVNLDSSRPLTTMVSSSTASLAQITPRIKMKIFTVPMMFVRRDRNKILTEFALLVHYG